MYSDGGVTHKRIITEKPDVAYFAKSGKDMNSIDSNWEKYVTE